mgnify:CR=1 FL=1
MAKVGIFGGTFNPVHKEHIVIALKAKEELSLDKLLIFCSISISLLSKERSVIKISS